MSQIRCFLRKKLTTKLKKINSAENLNKRIEMKYCVESNANNQEIKVKGKRKFAEKMKTAKAVVCQLS